MDVTSCNYYRHFPTIYILSCIACCRLPINRIQTGLSRQYRLHFQNCLPQTLFTGSKIEAEGRVPVQIAIMNTESNKNVTSGPLASAKIEILVLDGDFGGDDQMEWTEKEFGDSVVRERDGKRPLLTGELVITLNNGVGYLGDAAFTDNSSWIRSRKFRLGARLLQSKCTDVSIKEAIGGPFFVKDHRGECKSIFCENFDCKLLNSKYDASYIT